jgi:hypothetical protein
MLPVAERTKIECFGINGLICGYLRRACFDVAVILYRSIAAGVIYRY